MMFLSEELALNIFALSDFDISDSVEDGFSLCKLILELDRHTPW